MTPEEFMDGLALWEEYKPQFGEDWVAIAGRCLADGEDGSKGSPIFHALMIQTAKLRNAYEVIEEDAEVVWLLRRALKDEELARLVDAAVTLDDLLSLAAQERQTPDD